MGENRKLKGARVEKGLTQKQLAEKMGITKKAYYNKENGKTEFKQSEINVILNEVDRKYEDIFLD